jgi:hypothetical protein
MAHELLSPTVFCAMVSDCHSTSECEVNEICSSVKWISLAARVQNEPAQLIELEQIGAGSRTIAKPACWLEATKVAMM